MYQYLSLHTHTMHYICYVKQEKKNYTLIPTIPVCV